MSATKSFAEGMSFKNQTDAIAAFDTPSGVLSAAVVSTTPTSGSYLRTCLQQTGFVHSVTEWSLPGDKFASSAELVPDVVLLDLSQDTEPYFTLAAQVRRMRPNVRILACSPMQEPDPELLLQAMRAGVQDFLRKPINATTLQETLARFIQESGPGQKKATQKVIVVAGAKGGVGTSTVAINLGVQLARLTRKRVVLLDFARPLGHTSLLLSLQPRFTIRDAVQNVDNLDSHFLGGLLTRHESGLEVLAGTSSAEEWSQIPVAALSRVVNVAQSSSDHVLLDFGSVYSSEWSPILRLARMILLVAEAHFLDLWAIERHLNAIAALGPDPERIRIVINRWHAKDERALKALEKSLKRSVFAYLPNDFLQVSEATNQGVPLSRNHDDPLGTQFRQLACQLAGIIPPNGTKRGMLSKLLGSFS